MAFWTFFWTKGKVAKFATSSGGGVGALLRIQIYSMVIILRPYYRHNIFITNLIIPRSIFAFIF